MRKIIAMFIIFFTANIFAASGPNGVSVYLSTGYNPTGMGLTEFMNRPFDANFINISATTENNSITGKGLYAPMSLNDNNERFDSIDSKNTYSTGTAFSAGLKFNFLKFLFLRSDFTFDSNSYLPIYYNGKIKYTGNTQEPLPGAEVTYQFSYESMSVPLVFGINIPVELNNRYKADIYIGAGAAWTMTKYIFSIDAPFGYTGNYAIGLLTPYNSFKENLEFKAMTFGYTWIIGADYKIFSNLRFFLEIDSYIYNTVISKTDYKSQTMQTATVGGPKAEMNLSHTIAKIGVSYEFSGLIRNFFF
ncbi:MAG: hypothetical protein JW982_10495 [Spirochaetes bacterium]|nr:hypothetical protein [Spirochaetota bacterium]